MTLTNTNTSTCLPETSTCSMYNETCYPCPFPFYGSNCTDTWSNINAPHSVISPYLYAIVGFILCILFSRRLYVSKKSLKSAGWRVIDKVWLLSAIAAFLQIPQYIVRPIYGTGYPPIIFSNLMDIIMTLSLIQIEILMVTEWVSIMAVKGKVNKKPSLLKVLEKIASAQLWTVSIFGTIMEQVMIPQTTNGNDGKQNIPIALVGGNLFDFRGAYNTRWNALKNLNHGFVGTMFTIVGVVAAQKIRNQLKNSKSESTKYVVSKLMTYIYCVCLGISLDLMYGLLYSFIRLQKEFYYEYPTCSAFGEYVFIASLMKIFILSVLLYITKDSVRNDNSIGLRRKNSTRSSRESTTNVDDFSTNGRSSNDAKITDTSQHSDDNESSSKYAVSVNAISEKS